MTSRKVFIGNRTAVEVVCPQCDRSLTVPVEKIQSIGKPVRAKCTCGIQFTVVFERRASYRKPTGLLGKFARKVNSELQVGEAVINDLSRGGLSMKVPAGVDLKIGEVIRIDFRLDNVEQTMIRAQVIVKSIRRGTIGAEFHSLEEHTRKQLGFYLMP